MCIAGNYAYGIDMNMNVVVAIDVFWSHENDLRFIID